MSPVITSVEQIEFEHEIRDLTLANEVERLTVPRYGPEHGLGTTTLNALRINTDVGISGEYVKTADMRFLDHLVGENPLARERIWDNMRHRLIRSDRSGYGPIDVALWDFAGKYHDAPIHELLGTYQRRFPAQATTYVGDEDGGLDSPEAYADFAEECLERGYRSFKIHPWVPERGDVERHVETIRAVGERVGDEMDLAFDSACFYKTFGDALKVGKALDEQDYFYFEDPYRETSLSLEGNKKLREHVDTPLLLGEFARGGPQAHTDFMVNGSTDYIRADVDDHGGITGAMKIARAAEGFGVDVEFNRSGPAQRHCIAATRNTNYYEMALVHPKLPWFDEPFYAGDFRDGLEDVDDEGMVEVPDGPGLGVEYDWDYIESNAVDWEVYD